jgi:hypothetical protein
MFAFLLSVVMYFVTAPSASSAPAPLSLPIGSQSLDFYPSAPNNTLDCDDVACEKSEWDMISVALRMYKLYWVELRQKQPDERPIKRRRFEVMPSPTLCRENSIAQIANAAGGLGSAMWNFFAQVISLLPNLGARASRVGFHSFHCALHLYRARLG